MAFSIRWLLWTAGRAPRRGDGRSCDEGPGSCLALLLHLHLQSSEERSTPSQHSGACSDGSVASGPSRRRQCTVTDHTAASRPPGVSRTTRARDGDSRHVSGSPATTTGVAPPVTRPHSGSSVVAASPGSPDAHRRGSHAAQRVPDRGLAGAHDRRQADQHGREPADLRERGVCGVLVGVLAHSTGPRSLSVASADRPELHVAVTSTRRPGTEGIDQARPSPNSSQA
jgi:hypothetical protein